MYTIELQPELINKICDLTQDKWRGRTLLVNGLTFFLDEYKGTTFPKFWFKVKDKPILLPHMGGKKKKVHYLRFIVHHEGKLKKNIGDDIVILEHPEPDERAVVVWALSVPLVVKDI